MLLPPVTCTALSVPNWRLVRSVTYLLNATTDMGGLPALRIKVVDAGFAIYFAVLPSVLRSRSLHQAEIVRLPPKFVP
jgi:hypothetical protein